jgi:hypothetical protein
MSLSMRLKWVSSPFAEVKNNPSLENLRGCAGLYQLLVTPDPAVRYAISRYAYLLFLVGVHSFPLCLFVLPGREWAKKMVTHFGKIELTGEMGEDQYFLDVLEEWVYILENQTFNKPVLSLELRSTEDLKNVSSCGKASPVAVA